jgi:putative hydrolase of the HAD superfamily
MKLGGSLAQRSALKEVSEMLSDLERTPPHVLEGVPETLSYLAARHRMLLFTEGEAAEQAAKVERSGVQGFFDAIEIVAKKSAAAYQDMVNRHHVVKSAGWVVGNNPRTDINPALQAGLNAAFVPHASTWESDHGELQSGMGKLLVVARFRDLRDHF